MMVISSGASRYKHESGPKPQKKDVSRFAGGVLRLKVPLAAFFLAVFTCICAVHEVAAETFNNAYQAGIDTICEDGGGSNFLCSAGGAGTATGGSVSSPTSSSSGFSGQPSGSTVIEQRLQSIREAEEERPKETTMPGVFALRRYGGSASDTAQLQLNLPPATGGPSPEIILRRPRNFGMFISAGAYAFNHHNNRFEDGYEAQLPTVTIGGDYVINDWFIVGLALNYTNFNGTYDDGGGFNKSTYGPLLYASFLPIPGAFTDLVLGYARQEVFNRRRAFDGDEAFVGNVSSDYSENQYTAALLSGYDQVIGDITVGPRLGLALAHWQTDPFKEDGGTGFELRYSGLNQTSLQSILGLHGSVMFRTSFGDVLPEAGIGWGHEFNKNARNIEAEFVEPTPSPTFTFNRESPARNWANIGLGVSAFLPNGFQTFITFSTIQGNKNFVSYGGAAGVRKNF